MFSKQNLLQYASYLIFTLVVVGIALGVYGGYIAIDSYRKINELNDREEAVKNAVQGSTTQVTDPQGLMYSTIALNNERKDASSRRDYGIRVVGAGIISLAAGWLLRDFAASYQRRLAQSGV